VNDKNFYMTAEIVHQNCKYTVDFQKYYDLSIPMGHPAAGVAAWYVDPVSIKPVQTENWIGSVKAGGAVNFTDVRFNPHGNGTHTECVGHISREWQSINQELKEFFMLAEVITVLPELLGDDSVISLEQIQHKRKFPEAKALVIRTLPNGPEKTRHNYSNTNPPYLEAAATRWMAENGVDHLLIDLPSVDREVDGGALAAHRAFWNFPEAPRLHATITELIYVPEKVKDTLYFLNLQIAPFENDATPSKPVLFKTKKLDL
jgi:kynurenine formamidase